MSSGLPEVLLKPETCSRTCVNVYEPLHEKATGPRLIGESRTLTCPVCDLRSDRTSETRANDCEMRASRAAMAPVAGTMLVVWTKTGRFSCASEKRWTLSKLRSTERCWFRFSEYDPSMFVVKRASRMLP